MNAMIDRNKRENPNVTDRLEREIVALKGAMRRAERMGSLAGHDGWLAARETIKGKQAGVKVKLENHRDLPDREVACLLTEQNCYENFVNMIDDFQANIGAFASTIENKEKELERRRATKSTAQ